MSDELDDGTVYTSGRTTVGLYVEYDAGVEGYDGPGWILGLSGPGLTAEYSISRETAAQVVADWLSPRDE